MVVPNRILGTETDQSIEVKPKLKIKKQGIDELSQKTTEGKSVKMSPKVLETWINETL